MIILPAKTTVIKQQKIAQTSVIQSFLTHFLTFLALFSTDISPVKADSGYLSLGIGGGPDDLWSWQSITWSPFSEIDETGFLISVAARGETKTYQTELPGRTDVDIFVQGFGGDAELGWQWIHDHGSVSLLAGIAWRDFQLSPNDPNSTLATNDFSARATIKAQYDFSQSFGIFGYGKYLPQYEQWFIEAKPYYVLDSWFKIGPEISLSSGEDYLHARGGIFVTGYEVGLPWVGRFWLGASAGALIDTETTRVTPYAGMNLTRKFDIF